MAVSLQKYGTFQKVLAENLAFGPAGAQIPELTIITLVLDNRVPDRGHRENIFDPSFTIMGAAVGDHINNGYETCQDFAGGFTPVANPPVGAIPPLTVAADTIVKPKGNVTNPCNLACEPDGRIELSHPSPT